MEASESFKSFIIYAVFILICGLLFLIYRWPQGKHMSFSQHAAAYRFTYLYYIVLFSITLPLLLLFMSRWFAPMFDLSVWFIVFIAISAAAQFIVVLIPDSGGKKSTYHRFFAFLSAILLLPALLMIIASDEVSNTGRLVSTFSLISMISVLGILIRNRAVHKDLLLLQTGYFTAFFMAILSASYILF